jgi:hypothetical protein
MSEQAKAYFKNDFTAIKAIFGVSENHGKDAKSRI